jgi:hypothetical protein
MAVACGRSTRSLDCTVDPLPHIKQDPEYVDAGITVWLAIIGAISACVAYLMYEFDHPNFAIAFGIVGALGLSGITVPYSKLRAHFTRSRRGAK